ncbi:MAG: ABC transporter substrate-binding protein [Clostridiales bacterium]|nr:ABC transporter substrate-binding protein [Clostridiales bacterium]
MKKKSLLMLLVVALVLLVSITAVACKPETVAVTGVTLDREVLSLVVGTEGTLVATVAPEDATDKTVAWTIADEAVATISATGVVTAVAVGETEATVTTTDGSFTAACDVIVTAVPVAATGLALNKATLEISTDGKYLLRPVFTPRETTNQDIASWTSSNTAVATVTNGLVVAVTAGTTTITAVSEDGDFEATCEVTVAARADGVLVVGYSPFSSKFSPFFSKTAYDQDVAAMTQVGLLTTDRLGNLILQAIEGETTSYMGTEYLYTGIADITIDKSEVEPFDTTYTIEIRDDLVFSDNDPMTIDDVIFTMYALCDPTYTGSSTLYSTNIKGMDAYRTDNQDMSVEAAAYIADLTAIVAAVEAEEIDPADFTVEQQEMVDWAIEKTLDTAAWASWAYSYSVAQYISFGYGDEESTDEEVYLAVATDEILGGFYDDYKAELETMKEIELIQAYIALHPEEKVQTISGITKTGDYSMTVVTDGFEATTIYQLGVSVTPLHYYGDVAKYNYAANQFGFDKGDLSTVQAKTTEPMGAGAYTFDRFENGIVYFEANQYYYKGEPIIQNIQFRETSDTDKVSGIIAGTFDVTDPSLSNTVLDQIKDANSNSEISGDFIKTSLVDNLGYGYIGINASRVKIGESDSAESKALRKAYATLFAAYREVVVNSYYGDRASVIEYPISNTSWAAPQPTDDGYAIAYSVDTDGEAIYTAGMTAQQKYDAALAASIEFFEAAGYTRTAGVFTTVPELTAHIPADGQGDHPAFGILTYVKAALATIGVTLNITDYADSNNFWPVLEGNQADIWCAAWGATIDPDMYQVYHSSNAIGAGGTDSNHYSITDQDLDDKIVEARQSDDQAVRKALYKECLEIIMDWGVEIPTYQRKNAIVFSPKRVDLETLTPDITTFWGWMNDIELLDLA